MKPLSTSLFAALALAGFAWSVNAYSSCKPISGTFQLDSNNYIPGESAGTCSINTLYKDHFPSVTFLTNPGPFSSTGATCFTGKFSNGQWGSVKLTGISVSGLTQIAADLPPIYPSGSLATAATVVTFKIVTNNTVSIPAGSLYFLDTIHFLDNAFTAEEQLVITEGSGIFFGAKGSLSIIGNELGIIPALSPASVKGTLCLPFN